MNPQQANQLATLLRNKREALGLSASEVARQAGVTAATVTRLELRQIPGPKADSLTAIAKVLQLPRADVFAAAGWVASNELPTLRPYLRSKYGDLTEDAMVEVEEFISKLTREGGRARADRD